MKRNTVAEASSSELAGARSASRGVFWHACGFSLFVNLLMRSGLL